MSTPFRRRCRVRCAECDPRGVAVSAHCLAYVAAVDGGGKVSIPGAVRHALAGHLTEPELKLEFYPVAR